MSGDRGRVVGCLRALIVISAGLATGQAGALLWVRDLRRGAVLVPCGDGGE